MSLGVRPEQRENVGPGPEGLLSLRASATPNPCVGEGGPGHTLIPRPPTTVGNKPPPTELTRMALLESHQVGLTAAL